MPDGFENFFEGLDDGGAVAAAEVAKSFLRGVDHVVPRGSHEELSEALVKGCFWAEEHDLARQYYEEMRSKGLMQECRSLEELAAATQRRDRIEVAEWWFGMLLRVRFHGELSTACQHIVVNSAAKSGNPPTALRWFQWTDRAGVEPTVLTFAFLVDAAVKKGDFAAAARLFETAVLAGLSADSIVDAAAAGKARRG